MLRITYKYIPYLQIETCMTVWNQGPNSTCTHNFIATCKVHDMQYQAKTKWKTNPVHHVTSLDFRQISFICQKNILHSPCFISSFRKNVEDKLLLQNLPPRTNIKQRVYMCMYQFPILVKCFLFPDPFVIPVPPPLITALPWKPEYVLGICPLWIPPPDPYVFSRLFIPFDSFRCLQGNAGKYSTEWQGADSYQWLQSKAYNAYEGQQVLAHSATYTYRCI